MNAAAFARTVATREHSAVTTFRPETVANQRQWFGSLVVLGLTATLLLALHLLRSAGYTSLSSLDLWGRTLLAADGAVMAPSIIAAFPPLPYFAAISIQLAAPAFGPDILSLITAGFFALMLSGWFSAFRDEGFSLRFASLATVLLACNPVLLRSVAEGPGWASLLSGLSMLAIGLFNLRRDHRITDVILVALSLPVIILSDPSGMIVVLAAIPFIALCLPELQMQRSPWGVMLTMLFPGTFVFFGYAYTNWIFNDDPWAFLGGLAEIRTAPPIPLSALFLTLTSLLVTAPILPAIILRTRRQSGLRRGAIAIGGCALAAIGLGWLTQIWTSPIQMAAMGVPLAMAAATRWPRNRSYGERLIIGLLAAGWIGGACMVWTAPDAESVRLRAAITGAPIPAADSELAALGLAIQGYDDVLFDAEAAPAAVAHRESAAGIAAATSMRFRLAGMRQHADARVQVVRDTRAPRGADAMGRTFPRLYEKGAPGYRLLQDGPQWRAWIKEEQP